VRAVVRDQHGRAIIHLLNLNVRRLSSFEDQVTPATNVRITCRVPFRNVRSVRALTADTEANRGELPFAARRDGAESVVEFAVPRLDIATLVAIER
jgi:hypothetical protein